MLVFSDAEVCQTEVAYVFLRATRHGHDLLLTRRAQEATTDFEWSVASRSCERLHHVSDSRSRFRLERKIQSLKLQISIVFDHVGIRVLGATDAVHGQTRRVAFTRVRRPRLVFCAEIFERLPEQVMRCIMIEHDVLGHLIRFNFRHLFLYAFGLCLLW